MVLQVSDRIIGGEEVFGAERWKSVLVDPFDVEVEVASSEFRFGGGGGGACACCKKCRACAMRHPPSACLHALEAASLSFSGRMRPYVGAVRYEDARAFSRGGKVRLLLRHGP